jgi:hypothetical protein
MGTPVLVLVAEDRAVLEALVVDLDRRFGVDYQLLTGSRLPVVGWQRPRAGRPLPAELTAFLGASTHPAPRTDDVAIVSAGPAGLAAAVSAASEGWRRWWWSRSVRWPGRDQFPDRRPSRVPHGISGDRAGVGDLGAGVAGWHRLRVRSGGDRRDHPCS